MTTGTGQGGVWKLSALHDIEASPPRLTLGALFGAFLKVSMYGFGGTTGWGKRNIVDEGGWFGGAEFN